VANHTCKFGYTMKQRVSRKSTVLEDKRADALDIFRLANSAWESGRYKKAFDLFLEAAELGAPSAQHNVGYFYDVGLGTKKNASKALFWYLRAWRNHGQTDSCINIAQLYASKGKVRNAVSWWTKAIRLGDADAALDLAKFYLTRKSERERKRAVALLQKVLVSRQVTEDSVEEASMLLKSQQAAAKRG
jgi:TPR repeat protein